MRIISLTAMGLLRKEMLDILGVKMSTINTHFNRIYKTLELPRANPLVVWALRNGFDYRGNYNGEFLFNGMNDFPPGASNDSES